MSHQTIGVLSKVAAERARQDLKWGEQNHPDGTGAEWQKAAADKARANCDLAHDLGIGTYWDILSEEFWEASAESDPVKLREELIQVSAVAVAWAEKIDRDLA